jgi:hypothetical protein
MFLFPACAAAASRDSDMTHIDPGVLDPAGRAMLEEAGLDIDQWIHPAALGGRIREQRAHGMSMRVISAATFPDPVPVFVARCWAVEDLVRTRRTLRRIRRDIHPGGTSNA